MNDYAFGNHLYQMRQRSGFSQSEVAAFVGVTNKAVSKWENGNAKPTVQAIRKLADLFKCSPDDMLTLREEKRKQTITKIVLTGGPCAGKTTAMSWIQNAFTERGYTVLFVPETATELIRSRAASRRGPAQAT